MKTKWIKTLALMLALLTLMGCAGTKTEPERLPQTEPAETAVATVPPTVPADGDPEDVTCKGSYTDEGHGSVVVASLGEAVLTNSELNAWYWAAVADCRESEQSAAPDFSKPLDTQPCPIDHSVNSWQQYFLRQALNNWHSAMALKLWGDAEGLEPEEAYQPNLDNHEKYLADIPAMQYHYSYNLETFHPNSLHQAYLDGIPEMLETIAGEKGYADGEALAAEAFGTSLSALQNAVETYNRGYMYFTTLTYTEESEQEEAAAASAGPKSGALANLRHILLVPENVVEDIPSWKLSETQPRILEQVEISQDGRVSCSEEAWAACLARAEKLLKDWRKERNCSEYTFAELARKCSGDPGSAVNGGAYYNLRQGQLKGDLDAWCFDSERLPGDTTIIRSEYGCHILYFSGYSYVSQLREEEEQTRRQQEALVEAARRKYPMEANYERIVLQPAQAAVSGDELLYPDLAHERYPEAPVFLQQDYGGTLFGGDLLRTNGCGITTFSMLATYMTDVEYTPPEMCARYGNYSYQGTDGRIFQLESPVLGFYCKEKTYDPNVARQALEDGYPVVSLQHKGYWTRGGHYLLVEKMNEDGTVQVRDSNIFNYGKLDGHKEDRFKWSLIPANGSGFWIFEKKVTRIPACTRCGEEGTTRNVLEDSSYICEKCTPALLRRSVYQSACAQ